jgi:hypothetical protein
MISCLFDVLGTGENVPLEKWCSKVRCSYKKIQNNQMPSMKLSDEQIQRYKEKRFAAYLAFGEGYTNLFEYEKTAHFFTRPSLSQTIQIVRSLHCVKWGRC